MSERNERSNTIGLMIGIGGATAVLTLNLIFTFITDYKQPAHTNSQAYSQASDEEKHLSSDSH